MNVKLKYIKYAEIDKVKWDNTVSSAQNSNVFCYSWYLDTFCSWDIIVFGDYEGCIALPIKSTFGINNIYQPNFLQKCCWFGKPADNEIKIGLHNMLQKRFSLIHFNTNLEIGNTLRRTNLTIALNSDISIIRSGYSRSLKRNLKKINANTQIDSRADIRSVIQLYRQVWGKLNPQLSDKDYELLQKFAVEMPKNFECLAVSLEGEYLAGILLVKGKNRLHYILGASSAKGKKLNSLSYLLDATFEKHASSNYTFDFEGSSIPSVKSFYNSFGATDEPFYEVELSSKLVAMGRWAYKRLARL